MKVCIDIQAAISQRAGVGRYTKLLTEHLGALAGHDELRLFYFDFKRNGVPFPVAAAEQRAVHWCPGRVVQQSWKTIGWPPFDWFSGAADVFHFPNFIRPPLTAGRSVVTIHDVSFLRFPETTEKRNLQYLTRQIHNTVERADAIITDSAFSADEIAELLGAERDRLFPIHLGLAPELSRPSDERIRAVRSELGLDGPYLLTVGTLEPRKNVPFLVDVFEHLDAFDGTLVVAGMRGWKFEPILERIEKSPKAARIRYMDYVTDDQLPALYAGADLFVFPSLYEGFGFPPLEAMACGTPVLSSPAGSLGEVLGDGATLVAGYATDEWAEAARLLLGDQEQRETMRGRGLQRASSYSWPETAEKTWDVYRSIGVS